MAVLATENWSARAWQPTKTGTRQFIVTGVDNEQAAIGACPGISKGSTFPQDSTIRVLEWPVVDSSQGPTVYMVTWTFAPQPGIGSTNVAEKLNLEPVIDVRIGVESQFSGLDPDGNPYLNAVGDPIGGPPSQNVPMIQIDIIRYETSFDVAMGKMFTGTRNASAFVITFINGGAEVKEGEGACLGITPVAPVRLSDLVIPIKYSLVFREGGFYDYILNEGLYAWRSDGSNGKAYEPITDAAGNPVTSPVRLAADGRPFDTTRFKVGGQASVASPYSKFGDATYDVRADAVYLKRPKYRKADWTGMSLFRA